MNISISVTPELDTFNTSPSDMLVFEKRSNESIDLVIQDAYVKDEDGKAIMRTRTLTLNKSELKKIFDLL